MFTSKKKLQLIDYQDSYYYRKQRNKRRNKSLKFSFILLLIIVVAVILIPFAQSSPLYLAEQAKTDNALIQGPQLVFDHPNPAMRATLPIDIEASVEINGLVAYALIKQTFINPHGIALEGKYQFPLPDNSAVKQLIIKVGDKEIVGKIMEKKAAKALYQKAKRQGKKASLLEQHRPNLFTNKIANIPAQSIVVVTLKFIMPVSFDKGQFTLTLPLAITERYQPKSSEPLNLSTINPSYTYARSVARSQSSINIALN
jgi:Ca-activated chloride channel family protein